ncbi:hypothetical protein [Myroides injenensis]|uniref:hypothetical protein n=1 Tax=Myroides injenensis TaxID=1183151 RepID=UPI0002881ACC|nr:hypothetical protein [Myroides injenensis]
MTTSITLDFIGKNFSPEFIEKAKEQTITILHALFFDFSIAEYDQDQSTPTQLFSVANYANGYSNYELSRSIRGYLYDREFTENEILYLTISFISSKVFQDIVDNHEIENEEDFDPYILDIILSKHLLRELPPFLMDYLESTILRFSSEFDISDGYIDNIYFEEKQVYYINQLMDKYI